MKLESVTSNNFRSYNNNNNVSFGAKVEFKRLDTFGDILDIKSVKQGMEQFEELTEKFDGSLVISPFLIPNRNIFVKAKNKLSLMSGIQEGKRYRESGTTTELSVIRYLKNMDSNQWKNMFLGIYERTKLDINS